MPTVVRYSTELYHHGIKGQKWGVRRYQNEDGTLTPEGKKRYGSDHVITKDNWNSKRSQEYLNDMSESDRKRAERNILNGHDRAMTVKRNESSGKRKVLTSIVGTSQSSQKKINRENAKKAAAIALVSMLGGAAYIGARNRKAIAAYNEDFRNSLKAFKGMAEEERAVQDEFVRQYRDDWEKGRREMYDF